MKPLLFASVPAFLLLIVPFASPQWTTYETFYEWRQVDYMFPNDAVRNEALQNGDFVPVNCVPSAIKVFRDVIFIATPRYRPGVPATLSIIPYKKSYYWDGNRGPKLSPFPSWEMNQVGNCAALQLVEAMELDIFNRLWIVDVGRINLLTATPKTVCPAKLVIYDLNTNRVDKVYTFPDAVVSQNANAIKDIQVACTSREDCHSYISNLNVTCSLVVYDYKNNDSWFATHSSMQPDEGQTAVKINGVLAMVPFGITGLALTPTATNYSTLYYSKMAGDHIYSVSTTVMKDSVTLKQNPTLPDSTVNDLGAKPMGQADGTAMDNWGRLYFGSLPESAVYFIDTNGNPTTMPKATRVVYSNSREEFQWPDTFSFDGVGNLLFTATRFHQYANNAINPAEVNFKLIRFRTDSIAYYAARRGRDCNAREY